MTDWLSHIATGLATIAVWEFLKYIDRRRDE